MMIKELKLTRRKKLLGAVIISALMITGLTMWYTRPVAEAAILDPHPGLVGWWRFDEGTGTVAKDSSGKGNDGIYGATWVVEGKYGNASSFDGIDDKVVITSSPSLTNFASITVLMWIKAGGYTGSAREPIDFGYWSSSYGFLDQMQTTANKHVWYLKNTDGVISSTAVPFAVDEWELHGFVWDGTNWWTVRNGVLSNQKSFSGLLSCNAYNPTLGTRYSGHQPFDGAIDEVRIYNRALSAAEIQENFQKDPDFSSRLLAKVAKGTTQFMATLSWQGIGSINATIESPIETYTEDMVPVYQKTVYSSNSGDMLNIKRLAVSVTALPNDENWYITLEFDEVEDYKITVEVQR